MTFKHQAKSMKIRRSPWRKKHLEDIPFYKTDWLFPDTPQLKPGMFCDVMMFLFEVKHFDPYWSYNFLETSKNKLRELPGILWLMVFERTPAGKAILFTRELRCEPKPGTVGDMRWTYVVVEPTHLKNMIVKLDHFCRYGWPKKKGNRHLAHGLHSCALVWPANQ